MFMSKIRKIEMKIVEKQVFDEVQGDGIDGYVIGFLIFFLGICFRPLESYSMFVMELFKLDMLNPISFGYIIAFTGITIGLFLPMVAVPAIRRKYRVKYTYPRIGYVKLFMLDKYSWLFISLLLYGGQAVLYMINDFIMGIEILVVIYWSCVLASWKLLIAIHYKSKESFLHSAFFILGGVLSAIFVIFDVCLEYYMIAFVDVNWISFNSLSLTKTIIGIILITIGWLKRKRFVKKYQIIEPLGELDE